MTLPQQTTLCEKPETALTLKIKYATKDGTVEQLITIQNDTSSRHQVNGLCTSGQVPLYLETLLLTSVDYFATDLELKAQDWNLLLQEQVPKTDPFVKSFQHIVNKEQSLFETLMQLENNYQQQLQDRHEQYTKEKEELYSNYRSISHMYSESESNHLKKQASEGHKVLQAKYLEETELLRQQQSTEYHEFVTKVYQELKERKEDRVVETVIKKIERQPSEELLALAPETKEPPVDPVRQSKIQELVGMGFEVEQATIALEIVNGDTERAIALIFETPEMIQDYKKAKTAPQTRNTSPEPQVRKSRSTMQVGEPEHPFSLAKARSFGSFTNKLFSEKKENPLAKMSSFLGKAMDAFLMEDDKKQEELCENFSIYCGSQIKTLTQLRLQVTDTKQLFKEQEPAQQMALKTQIYTTLYSQNLNGLIVMVKPSELKDYGLSSCNQHLFERIHGSTDFHFESFQKQYQQAGALQVGDYFITKHSNLNHFHLVFHLVCEEQPEELNGQSPVIAGYRQLLQTAHQCSVKSLQIPFDLYPEDPKKASKSGESTSVKRCRTVFKQTRGFLNEMARGKQWSGSYPSNVTGMVLVFSIEQSIKSAEYFHQSHDILSEIFRTQ